MAITLDVANVGQGEASGGAVTSVALTTSAAVAVGGRIFVGVGMDTSGADMTVSVVSGGSLTWIVEGTLTDQTFGFGAGVGLAYADAPAGLASSTVITATLVGGPAFDAVIAASSYLGISGVRDVERTDVLAGGTAWATGSLTTSEGGEIVITAACGRFGVSNTPTAPGIEDQDYDGTSRNSIIILQRRIEASAGSYALAGTFSTAQDSFAAVTAAYKAAAVIEESPILLRPTMSPLRW